ncbi:hypothetical protein NEF87_002577 [Candidatus Lokiarchaeum ossiferum]|uniref:CAAX prenyl protease 2/Lysostaphin resistance protein A-like domain-containing protein n=1 Tax=Candidatus Lokiarchaeum ossiferum TaxID=2951803 RepID=A0ABY6HS00_9ARCH|nr:hypothetical protein NEF87_002577 [Candidatus Lokiarchaeum sp. B-35]
MESKNDTSVVTLETIWDKDGREDIRISKKSNPIWLTLLITVIVAGIFLVIQNLTYDPVVNWLGMTGFTLLTGFTALVVWGGGLIAFGIMTKRLTWEDVKAKPVQFGGIKWIARTFGIAILSYIASIIISVVMVSILPVQPNEVRAEIVMGGGNLAIGVLTASILVPIAEELFFRGYLFTSLRKRSSFWIAAIISSACFGLIHGDPIAIVYAFMLGLIIAGVYEKSKSIYISILLHMLINFISTMVGMLIQTYLM